MEIKTYNKGRSHLRQVVVDGRPASWLTVIDYRMRVGSAAVKMGALAFVETSDGYRMKGHMRALIEDTVRYMQQRRYVLSVVSGIADFYGKFGYLGCMPDRDLSVLTRVAERAARAAPAGRKHRTRKFRGSDSEKLLAIYDANTAGQVCSLVRRSEYFERFPKSRQEIVVVEDGRRRVVGYVVCEKSRDRARVAELGAASEDAFPALAGVLARLGISRRVSNVTMLISPEHPFAEFCQRHGCRWTVSYHRNAGAMMRIVDQQRLFRALAGDFGRRLRHSPLAGFAGLLGFKTDLAATTLRIRKGSVAVVPDRLAAATVKLPQGRLAQLVAGYRSVRDVLHDAGARVSPKVESLLDVLFPRQAAFIRDWSRFEELRLQPGDFE